MLDGAPGQDKKQNPFRKINQRTLTAAPTGSSCNAIQEAESMLATMQIRMVRSDLELSSTARALCDSGSQLNLITIDCVQRLGFAYRNADIYIEGVGGGSSLQAKGHLDLDIVSCHNDHNPISIRLLVVTNITSRMPTRKQHRYFNVVLKTDELADPNFWIPARIDILLGIGFWNQVVSAGVMREQIDSTFVMAQQTSFGWVITTHQQKQLANNNTSLHLKVSEVSEHRLLEEINDSVKRFWELESVPENVRLRKEDQLAEDLFVSTHQRDENGRYIVRLPFRPNGPMLGNSRKIALRQFLRLEEKCRKDPVAAKFLHDFFQDYLDTGHMIRADDPPADCSRVYYAPYHIIMGKKPRVVFNYSCKTDSGISLNDLQLPGPRMQDDQQMIFMRFRFPRYGLTADIEKMFRQIGVHRDDWNFQRILYRPYPNGPIYEYWIIVVVWGMTSASFNAVRALIQCAIDGASKYPWGSRVTRRSTYADDCADGAHTLNLLLELYRQLLALQASGGFKLAKWQSNSKEFMRKIGGDTAPSEVVLADTGVLGMVWGLNKDTISLKHTNQPEQSTLHPTKAQVVSSVSKVYDPTGLFAPVILIGKMIMQDFWKQPEIGWKDRAPEHLVARWKTYLHELPALTQITVPRWFGCGPDDRLECHIFTDASMRAYGAVAYMRVIRADGSIDVNIMTSKSKMAPLKPQTIPRLELFGAQMGAKLAKYIQDTLDPMKVDFICWCDSNIVLHWLRKDVGALTPFIGVRVSRILETPGNIQWKYVGTADNPADLLSRSVSPVDLQAARIWWKGPLWLSNPEQEWPEQQLPPLTFQEREHDDKETRKMPPKALITVPALVRSGDLPPGNPALDELSIKSQDGYFVSLLTRRSTLNSVLRIVAHVRRFVTKVKDVPNFIAALKEIRQGADPQRDNIQRPLPIPSVILPAEKEAALLDLVRIVQRQTYKKELKAFQEGLPLPASSEIIRLTPFWHQQDNTIRLTGRLANAALPFDEGHQLIVPYNHRIVALLVHDAHLRTNHGGPQLCLSILRQKFWIIKARIAVRKYIGKHCVQCIRHSKLAAQQLMGALPAVRVTPAPPFSRVGVDFAGPYVLRQSASTQAALRKARDSKTVYNEPHTTVKAWISIFVCMVTRAIHLEVLKGLTTEEFLMALARMTARRGPCLSMYSDNGTSFVGADNELIRVLSSWEKNFPTEELSLLGTTWTFIPPASPFKGGIWEAAVKSFKHHYRRVVGNRILTYDQVNDLSIQIEAVLNARPLFAASDDPTDLTPITPAHLVIGRSTVQRPYSEDVHEIVDNRLTFWGLQQKMYQQFWKSWKEDYIASLQRRNKWYQPQRNLKEGDMVLMQEENTPPSKWPLGRVAAVNKGADGLVRTVSILIAARKKVAGVFQMATTLLERPVQKLCILLPDGLDPPDAIQPPMVEDSSS